jgi:hypothetical protein
MESSKTVTSIFIAVALVALAALAISVNQKSAREPKSVPTLLPGLAENLGSVERITGFPANHIRSVRMVKTNGEALTVAREIPDSRDFQFETTPPESITPYSAILFANAAFLGGLSPNNGFSVTGITEETVIAKLTYTSFDGLVLKFVVFTAEDTTGLRMIAAYSDKLATRYPERSDTTLLSGDEIFNIARSLDGRIYKQPDDT